MGNRDGKWQRPGAPISNTVTAVALSPLIRGRVLPALRAMSKPYQPTPEQIALAEQKRAKRAQLATAGNPKAAPVVDDAKGLILPRKWIDLPTPESSNKCMRFKIMTWNVSAQ